MPSSIIFSFRTIFSHSMSEQFWKQNTMNVQPEIQILSYLMTVS
jgi:hypothetical protein